MASRADEDDDYSELPEAQEVVVEHPRSQGVRLAVALLLAGLVAGALALLGALLVGGVAQTEAGLCRVTWAPCSELSAASVESLSGVELPAGSEVRSGYAEETSTVLEFRAEVVLPEGGDVTLSNAYQRLDAPAPELVPAARGSELSYWTSYSSTGEGHSIVARATGDDGRTVLFFDTRTVR
jgi:hypothetical protein